MSLACDLMEPVRPQVDACVLDWLRREPWRKNWFFKQRDGNCKLTSEFAARLSETSKMWSQALGPFAEWIAHALWSTKSQASRAKAPATRLTQNRKREAKGILIGTPVLTPPISPILSRNYTPVESRENPLVATKPVRLNGHNPIAQARRADAQQRQAAALKAWNPSNKPDWLDVKFYRKQIQPRLAAIIVSAIASALAVSEPYATHVCAGRCIPHPRHWLKLW